MTSVHPTIPHVVHQVWVGNSPLPAQKRLITQSWRCIPGWTYRLWGDQDISKRNFPRTYATIQEVRRLNRPPAMIADLMRYEIIFTHGGVYADVNIELLRPERLQACIDEGADLILCHEDDDLVDGVMSCGFFAAVAGHAALRRLLAHVPNLDLRKPANIATGPYFFGRFVHDGDPSTHLLPTQAIYPFAPGSSRTCSVGQGCSRACPDSIAIDHFELGCTWCTADHRHQRTILSFTVAALLLVVGLAWRRQCRRPAPPRR